MDLPTDDSFHKSIRLISFSYNNNPLGTPCTTEIVDHPNASLKLKDTDSYIKQLLEMTRRAMLLLVLIEQPFQVRHLTH